MSGLELITAPSAEPIATSVAKTFLRIDISDDDTLIAELVKSARQFCEEYTGRALITQTWRLSLDGFIEADVPIKEGLYQAPFMNFYKRFITLPRAPLASVTHVKTFNDSDSASTYASSNYYVDKARQPGRVVLRDGSTWPTSLRVANAVEITYVSGYGSAGSDVPSPLIVGMKEHIAYLYEHRGDAEPNLASVPIIAKQLYQPYRILSFSNDPFANSGGY